MSDVAKSAASAARLHGTICDSPAGLITFTGEDNTRLSSSIITARCPGTMFRPADLKSTYKKVKANVISSEPIRCSEAGASYIIRPARSKSWHQGRVSSRAASHFPTHCLCSQTATFTPLQIISFKPLYTLQHSQYREYEVNDGPDQQFPLLHQLSHGA